MVVLPFWAAKLSHNHSLIPRPQRERRKIYDGKGLEAEIRTGGDHSPIIVIGKTDSVWGDYYNLFPITVRN